AHNSVDRDLMARDSIELTQYEPVSSRGKSRASSSRGEETTSQRSAISLQSDQDRAQPRARIRSAHPGLKSGASTDFDDDSELLINREDLDLDLDGEEAQFLRTNRRVPVRRNAIPK